MLRESDNISSQERTQGQTDMATSNRLLPPVFIGKIDLKTEKTKISPLIGIFILNYFAYTTYDMIALSRIYDVFPLP